METSFFCLLVGLFVSLLFCSLEMSFLFLGKLDRRLLTHAGYWDLWGINLEQLECSHPLRQKIVKGTEVVVVNTQNDTMKRKYSA